MSFVLVSIMIDESFAQDNIKLGLFGGTFNPPHLGHLRLAEEAASRFNLARVLFIPSFAPPHKSGEEIASVENRLHMTQLCCFDNPKFEVSDIEVSIPGPSYTVNTLRKLRKNNEQEFYFIIGSDSLAEIELWRDYEQLFHLSNFIVVTRSDYSFDTVWAKTPAALKSEFRKTGNTYNHVGGHKLISSQIQGLNISSTKIRNFIRSGKSIRYLVTEPVREYIAVNQLYQENK